MMNARNYWLVAILALGLMMLNVARRLRLQA